MEEGIPPLPSLISSLISFFVTVSHVSFPYQPSPSLRSHLEVHSYTSAEKFWAEAREFLVQNTAQNNLQIGLLDRAMTLPGSFKEVHMFLGKERCLKGGSDSEEEVLTRVFLVSDT